MWVMFVGLQLNERRLWYVCNVFFFFTSISLFSSLFLRLKIRIQCSRNYHFLILMFSICCFFFSSIKSLASKRLLHVQCASMHLCNLNGLRTGRKAKPSCNANWSLARRRPETALIANLGAARILFLCVAFWLHNLFKNQYTKNYNVANQSTEEVENPVCVRSFGFAPRSKEQPIE